MVLILLACNALAGAATALAFRPLAIVIAAPVLAAFTSAVLIHQQVGLGKGALVVVAALVVSQASFALVTLFAGPARAEAGAPGWRALLDRLRRSPR